MLDFVYGCLRLHGSFLADSHVTECQSSRVSSGDCKREGDGHGTALVEPGAGGG